MKTSVAILVVIVAVVVVCSIAVIVRHPRSPLMDAKFMLHDAEGPNAGAFSEELGVNTIKIYLDHAWSRVEPVNNQWSWGDEFFPSNTIEYSHCMLQIGALHMLAWNSTDLPGWVNKDNLDGEFKEQYGEFVQEAVRQVKQRNISVDLYLVELEANAAGHEIAGGNLTNAWIIDWIKWEVELIKSIAPDAKIGIPLTPTEFRPEESLDNTDDRGIILLADFVERMIQENVQFDAFGFNVASGAYDNVDNWTALQAVLDKWSTIDKEIFVWAMGYPANNDDNLPFHNPRAGGYSEEWQKEQYVNSLRLLLENPNVIGVSINLYDYQEPELATPYHWGLVGGDRTRPETLFKRPSFDAVKDFWHNNYR